MACPGCDGQMTLRGSYARKIRGAVPLPEIRVVRAECPRCVASHSLIPSFLVPRSPYLQQVREEAVRQVAQGRSLGGVGGTLDVARTTIKRWVRAWQLKAPKVAAAVRALLVHLNGDTHGELEELVARAYRALGFRPVCDVLASRVNVLLGVARSLGCLLPGVLLL